MLLIAIFLIVVGMTGVLVTAAVLVQQIAKALREFDSDG